LSYTEIIKLIKVQNLLVKDEKGRIEKEKAIAEAKAKAKQMAR